MQWNKKIKKCLMSVGLVYTKLMHAVYLDLLNVLYAIQKIKYDINLSINISSLYSRWHQSLKFTTEKLPPGLSLSYNRLGRLVVWRKASHFYTKTLEVYANNMIMKELFGKFLFVLHIFKKNQKGGRIKSYFSV